MLGSKTLYKRLLRCWLPREIYCMICYFQSFRLVSFIFNFEEFSPASLQNFYCLVFIFYYVFKSTIFSRPSCSMSWRCLSGRARAPVPPRNPSPSVLSASAGGRTRVFPRAGRWRWWRSLSGGSPSFFAILVFFHACEAALLAAFHGRSNVSLSCTPHLPPSLHLVPSPFIDLRSFMIRVLLF